MTEEKEELWDKIAREWDNYRNKTPIEIIEFIKNKKGKILDLGCGSGRNFIKKEGTKIYGVDSSKEMIKLAQKKAEKIRIEVELRKENSWNTKYEKEYFDSAICYSVLHCLEKKERNKTIKELYRVLKQGSEVLISVWGKNSSRTKNKGKECYIPWTVKGKTKIERYTYIFDIKEITSIIKSSGFKIVRAWEKENINVIARKEKVY